jgi:hypothetical protein
VGLAIVAGALAGIALLSKYTAFFTFVAGAAYLGLGALSENRKRDWVALGVFLGAGLLVCGWFYVRNVALYSDPFVGNWDEISGFHYEQNPSYRTTGFYTQFGSVFFHHPERARWTTWLNGNYASMWADPHNNFFPMENRHAYFWAGIMLILAALPSAAMAMGFIGSLISVWKRPAWNLDFLLVAVSMWTWGSLISFTMEVPTYSTVKAFFFLSLVPSLGVYLARGRAYLHRHARPARWALDATLILLGVLAVWVHRYAGQTPA